MPSEIVPVTAAAPALPATSPADGLVAAWLASLSPRTVRAYRGDLAAFVAWSGVDLNDFLRLNAGDANAAALGWRNSLLSAGLASATVNRRLAALRSLVELAGTLGRVTWTVGIAGVRPEPRRDTRGPDRSERKRLWRYLDGLDPSPLVLRNRALVALLFDLGLRRAEATALGLDDVEPPAGPPSAVRVLGKGRREKERLTLPPATSRALAAWLDVRRRTSAAGPVFVRLDPAAGAAGDLTPLTGDALARALRAIGRAAGLPRPLRPHGLRHASITAALDAGLDVRQVRRFSRHAKLETVIRYDDNREDLAGKVARRVAEERR